LTLAPWLTQASERSDSSVSGEGMEVQNNRSSAHLKQTGRRGVIVDLWQQLGKPVVDARLLASIQSRLVATFGNHETAGPAVIARILADEGAELRHPEIIEADVEWRQARIETGARQSALDKLSSPELMTLATAEIFIGELEEFRKRHELNEDRRALAEIRTLGSESRRLAESIARNRSVEQTIRHEQAEIAEWLKVWLQTPALFREWVELRKRSDEFRARFGEGWH
jgi:hypothetical protein